MFLYFKKPLWDLPIIYASVLFLSYAYVRRVLEKEEENIAEGQTLMRKQKRYLHARISTQKCRRAKKKGKLEEKNLQHCLERC
jgi:hypothetical protein